MPRHLVGGMCVKLVVSRPPRPGDVSHRWEGHTLARPRGKLLSEKPTIRLLVVLKDRPAVLNHPPNRQLKGNPRLSHQERHQRKMDGGRLADQLGRVMPREIVE
jgi:hypothetical protein